MSTSVLLMRLFSSRCKSSGKRILGNALNRWVKMNVTADVEVIPNKVNRRMLQGPKETIG